MGMSPEVRAEYEAILRRLVARHGDVVRVDPSVHGWTDYDLYHSHSAKCEITVTGTVKEDVWYEFAGTFADDDNRIHGVVATDANCACGRIKHRNMRWAASVSSVAEAVFAEMYEMLHAETEGDE